jgi:hypothetical protein
MPLLILFRNQKPSGFYKVKMPSEIGEESEEEQSNEPDLLEEFSSDGEVKYDNVFQKKRM